MNKLEIKKKKKKKMFHTNLEQKDDQLYIARKWTNSKSRSIPAVNRAISILWKILMKYDMEM